MRIIAGRFKGFRIPSPRAGKVRPTTDRVREALFSILGTAIEGARVLDLFAGTGAFGFEALSRGGSSVVFADRDRNIARTLAATAKALGIEEQVHILGVPADRAVRLLLETGDKFGIVFLDPPYGAENVRKLLQDPCLPDLLELEGHIVVETKADAPDLAAPSGLIKWLRRKYGGTLVEIYVREDVVPWPDRGHMEST